MGKSALGSRAPAKTAKKGGAGDSTGPATQPRRFESSDDKRPYSSNKRDNLMRLEVGNYQNLPLIGASLRQNLAQLNFLFNLGRQDSISLLLNSYQAVPGAASAGPGFANPSVSGVLTQNQRTLLIDASFPSFYINHRDSALPMQNQAPPLQQPLGADHQRPRGDSILLPPPISSAKPDFESSVSVSAPSRSNSIFSLLIQMPGSSGNSVSDGSVKKQPTGTAGGAKQRQSLLLAGDYSGLQDFENYFNKESLGSLLNWDQKGSVSQKRTRSSVDNPNAFWEGLNGGLAGSIAGLPITNEGLNGILTGISNGSIDLTNMSNEQRRDSILKFINDQQYLNPEPSVKTNLREDIFDKNKAPVPDKNSLSVAPVEKQHLLPASSMSSKSPAKYNDEPQSPKTSPSTFNTRLSTGVPPQFTQLPPQQVSHGGPKQQFPVYPNAGQYTYPNQQFDYQGRPVQYNQNMAFSNYQPSVFKGQPQYQPVIPAAPVPMQQGREYSTPKQLQPPHKKLKKGRKSPDISQLIAAQQAYKAEDGRPLLGATKVDQLMLVIQAREKGNSETIKRDEDGSILDSADKSSVFPPQMNLVGGVDKPDKLIPGDGLSMTEEQKKKKKGRSQQCPYCQKFFNQLTHLEVHVRLHIGYKPFECLYCHKKFTQGGNLRTHLRLHTGEKPFTCNVCDKLFSRKGNLAAHELTHNNLKPFACRLDGCEKLFTQLGNLKLHQNRFHLDTLNDLTQKLADLKGDELEKLPGDEKALLKYFKNLYKNSNKGIRGRGKRVAPVQDPGMVPAPAPMTSMANPGSNVPPQGLQNAAMQGQGLDIMGTGFRT